VVAEWRIKMEKRNLGKTGEKLSIVGFGGIIVAKVYNY
jgi:predicted aldo/keto reductase-like oxidoreductase